MTLFNLSRLSFSDLGTAQSQLVFFCFDYTLYVTRISGPNGPLRGGVTKKKRENLGQCPNQDWCHRAISIQTFLKIETPPLCFQNSQIEIGTSPSPPPIWTLSQIFSFFFVMPNLRSKGFSLEKTMVLTFVEKVQFDMYRNSLLLKGLIQAGWLNWLILSHTPLHRTGRKNGCGGWWQWWLVGEK